MEPSYARTPPPSAASLTAPLDHRLRNLPPTSTATGFALAVTHPAAGNIGGGGFMVVRLPDGRSTTFEFREKAPLAAHAEMFLDENGEYSSQIHHNSHLAVGVPGTVAGFALAHERLGSLAWSRLVQPAVELARDGFTLSEDLAAEFEALIPRFQPYPGSMHVFTKNPDNADESDPDDVMAASAATAFESPETTHYSVVDANGMAVSVTYTLEAGYGSKIVVPGAGFLLNNEMGDFNPRAGLTTETGLIGTDPNLPGRSNACCPA